MLVSTSTLMARHRCELSEAEIKQAIVEYIANRRPLDCPLEIADAATHMLKEHGTKVFSIAVEKQESRYGERGEMVDVTIVKFDYDVRTP